MIEEEFIIFHLDNNIDYRSTKTISQEQRMFFTPKNLPIPNLQFEQRILILYGRELIFERTHHNLLVTDFQELFTRDLSSSDYILICQSFDTIYVENIRAISEDETGIAIRLINFIDHAYLAKIKLFCSFDTLSITNLYPKGLRHKEFLRTISRLQEMTSASW